MAKVDHADAYKQLPEATKDELTAVVTLKSPIDGSWYGFIPHAAIRIYRRCPSLQLLVQSCRSVGL